MGSGSSVQVIKSVEVSFIDERTGRLLSKEKILKISDEVCKEFDYKPSYYNAYKPDKYGNNPYKQYAYKLSNNFI